MKNILPHFLLFITLIFLVGCTITKRRYTGGYYVSWHHKSPDTKPTLQTPIQELSNKQAGSPSSIKKTIITQASENVIIQKSLQPVSTTPKEKWITKIVRDNLIPKIVSSTYTVTPENISGHDQSENNTSKWDVRLSWLLCLLGFIGGLYLLVTVFFVNNSFWTGGGGSIAENNHTLGLILMLLPFTLFIVSLVYSFKAMKNRRNLGLISIVVLDIAGIITSLLLIILIFA